jgi:hypothetical protein
MNTSPLIERLRLQCAGFKFIGGAMDLNESTLQSVVFPAAFVLPLSETGIDQGMNALANTTEQVWAVVTSIKAVRTTAQDQSADLATLRAQIKVALQAWQPDATAAPMRYHSGQLESAEAGVLLWIDLYTRTKYPT